MIRETPLMWEGLPPQDRDILVEADAWPDFLTLNELSHEALLQVTRDRGMDFAVAVLYTRLLRVPRHAGLVARAGHAEKQPPAVYPRPVTLAFCPGAYYREIKKNGADGRVLREAAAPYVHKSLLVPTGSCATVAENGRFICQWLLQRPRGERIVLASLSKGSGDIKAALFRPEAPEAFASVLAWINISGGMSGLPIFNWLLRRPWTCAAYRLLFWCRGLDFRVVPNLLWGPGEALDFPLILPDHTRLLSVVGFPLAHHFGHPLLRINRQRMAPWGPNDGLMLLWDSCLLPGDIYPVWGADHFLRPSGGSQRLAAALAGFAVEELVGNDLALS